MHTRTFNEEPPSSRSCMPWCQDHCILRKVSAIDDLDGATIPVEQMEDFAPGLAQAEAHEVRSSHAAASRGFGIVSLPLETGARMDLEPTAGAHFLVPHFQRMSLGPPSKCIQPTQMDHLGGLRVPLQCVRVHCQIGSSLQDDAMTKDRNRWAAHKGASMLLQSPVGYAWMIGFKAARSSVWPMLSPSFSWL